MQTDVVTAPTVTKTITTEALKRRQATVSPTLTPAYASVCSDVAKYVSACSCVYGLTPTVVTVAAPLTTVGASTTVVSSTATARTTVATEVSTSTSVLVVTTTDATSTVTPTATVTADGNTAPRYRLRVSGGPFDGLWVKTVEIATDFNRPLLDASQAAADLFTYDPTGGYVRSVSLGGRFWHASNTGGGSSIWYDPFFADSSSPVTCQLDSSLRLQNCYVGQPTVSLLIYCPPSLGSPWLGIIPQGESRGCTNLGGVFQLVAA